MVPDVDISRPHMARIYDYFLGGKNHFAADRETAEQILQTNPAIRIAARENRAFLGRSVRYLAAEAGIRQFLDIGTGLPATNNVHEVAQAVTPAILVTAAPPAKRVPGRLRGPYARRRKSVGIVRSPRDVRRMGQAGHRVGRAPED